jgi:putative sigma-54 modulation protein
MNFTLSGHHVEVTPAIRTHVQSKLDRIKRNLDGVIDIMVILAVDNNSEKEKRHRAEISLNLSGKTIHVSSVAQDLYAAFDLLIDKLERQIVRHKGKIKEFSHDSVKRMNGEEADAA